MVDIVCHLNVKRYYGDNPKLLEKYRQITESGKCPFCPENIREEHKVVEETKYWNVVLNPFPYPNSDSHLLIVPKHHATSLVALTHREWNDMKEVIRNVMTEYYSTIISGYGLAVRDGELGGVTLRHLHWHLIVPKVGLDGQIPVNFGIG